VQANPSRRRAAAARALALVAVVSLAACGREGSVMLSAGAAPSAIDDLQAAQRVVLTATDLPGYEVHPSPDPNATSAQAAAAFSQCAGGVTLGDEERTASSPGFRRGAETAVSSLAMVARSEAEARAAMARLSRAELAGCLTVLLRAVIERDLRLTITSASTEFLPSATRGTNR
jgi:predicted small lipoprotein YifL